jgi:Ca2+-transporting ATPase
MSDNYKSWESCLSETSEQVRNGAGKNVIPAPAKRPLWLRYLDKFKDPLIIILLVILALSCLVTGYEYYHTHDLQLLFEPAGVMLAIILSTGIGFIFETKADKEFDVLNQVKDDRLVKVVRRKTDGSKPRLVTIRKADVVVGDIVRLESGDEVPADGRVLSCEQLRMDESAFTGEPDAVKFADKSKAVDEGAYDADFLLRGSIVLEGFCLYRVTAVGVDTEEGRGALKIMEDEEVETPLNRQLDGLGRIITRISYILAGLIVIGRMIYYFAFDGNPENNSDLLQLFDYTLQSVMIAVTLIVVAVPEGLPMSVTVSLALSMRKMLKVKNLVRKLHACETMGATTVICTDKTGTLTMNRMSVVSSSFDCPAKMIADAIAVNSTADLTVADDGSVQAIGNPTECALLRWISDELHADYRTIRSGYVVESIVPFSTETKYMETICRDKETGERFRFVKGAPEYVMAMCAGGAESPEALQAASRLSEYQANAWRTLGFAVERIGTDDGLMLTGVVGIADPVRPDVKEAIETCRKRAGVKVIVVTGDIAATAEHIGAEIGLFDDGESPRSLSGIQFAAMTDEQALEAIKDLRILSRARPEDKARLVGLLQQAGEVVAVTGDGTNDALALKKAQVGLSMGDGTARAKEVSDITILDNSFVSINKAILWGRSLYLNIRRFIYFQMTINVCACLLVLVGAFLGVDSPLTVTQMLWVNLIMDTFAAMALSSLPADPKVFDEKPRDPESHIIDKSMMKRIFFGGVMFFSMLILLWEILLHAEVNSVRDLFSMNLIRQALSGQMGVTMAEMTPYEMGIFFTTFVMLQFWNIFNAKNYRTGNSFFMTLFSKESFSWGFYLIVLVILGGQYLIVNHLGKFFDVAPLTSGDWGLIVACTSLVLFLPEIVRIFKSVLRNNS